MAAAGVVGFLVFLIVFQGGCLEGLLGGVNADVVDRESRHDKLVQGHAQNAALVGRHDVDLFVAYRVVDRAEYIAFLDLVPQLHPA